MEEFPGIRYTGDETGVITDDSVKGLTFSVMYESQKSLSRKTKGSSNRNKARLKVARMHQKITNQRMDYLHKLSKEIIRSNDIVCLEDLQVKNMVKNHKLAQAISDVSWSVFVNAERFSDEFLINIGRNPRSS